MEFSKLMEVNAKIGKTKIGKGGQEKDYVQVNQRILAFRELYSNGTITTELISCENGMAIFKASVFDEDGKQLGTGYSYEKEGSTFINKTSFIENCETSAVGRALGMLGIGVVESLASAEEVGNAIVQQEAMSKPKQESSKPANLQVEWAMSRTKLEKLGVDVRDVETNKKICDIAMIPNQDNRLLNDEQMTRLIETYKRIIAKKENEQKNSSN